MRIFNKVILTGIAAWSTTTYSAPFNDYTFKSPSFNGVGYSSHVLTIENQEFSRKQQVAKDIQAALDKAKADTQNSNIQKFLNNLESRIYAQISQNLATAMFANNNCSGSNSVGCSGTLNFEGNTIFWNKDSNNIYLQVTDTTGNQTTITVPLGTFQFGS
jgi:Type VIII secretion system (T8SS), CsgF protein